LPNLIVEKGKDKGMAVEIKVGQAVTIGRGSSNSMHLSDMLASRNHCRVEGRQGEFYVIDGGSRNGTFLNGRTVRESRLTPGDQILVGETLITLQTEPPAVDSLIGRNIGGHRILQLLGKGGMGRVYKALQLSLDRIVAIKILSRQYADNTAFIERFKREAMSLAQLNDPNIVAVFDVGESDGFHYFSMEHMTGGSISRKISSGRKLPPERAVRVMIDVARGLMYAEGKGIVHRDIKPENMMLDGQDNVKICDLGIAQSVNETLGRDNQRGVFGSPHYIAPEQARGGAADHRSDIYSLGASFYRIVTGRTIFKGSSARDIILKHIYEEPPPVKQLEPSLPNSLCRVLEKMIRKNPDERCQTAREVVDALEEVERKMRGPRVSHVRIRSKLKSNRATRKRAARLVAAGAAAIILVIVGYLIAEYIW